MCKFAMDSLIRQQYTIHHAPYTINKTLKKLKSPSTSSPALLRMIFSRFPKRVPLRISDAGS
ncbi:MAG: hypothetical protein ABIY90_14270 [Puia sp.]